MKKLLLLLLLCPSLAFGYTTKSGSLTTETWTVGTYLADNVSIGNSIALTVDAGVIVKVTSDDDFRVANSGTIDVNGTASNPVYFTACADTSIGEDTSGHANCDESSASPGDWGGLYFGNNSSTLEYFIIKYGGGVGVPSITGAYGSNRVTFENFIIEKNLGSEYLIETFDNYNAGAAGGGFWNGYMLVESNQTQTAVYVSFYPSNAAQSYYLVNNIIITPSLSTGSNGVFGTNHAVASSIQEVRNNTVICTNGSNTIQGLYAGNMGSNDPITDNIVQGCNSGGFYALGTDPSGASYNNAYDTGGWTGLWSSGNTGSHTNNPNFSEHLDGGFVPAWADDYHLGTGSGAINTGSRTASAAGLDSLHATDDNVNDSGTVDMGVHFPASLAVDPIGIRTEGIPSAEGTRF